MSAEETADIKKRLESIETAIQGTGNPHGGLVGRIEGLEGKVATLNVKIDGVKETLIEKIDGVESNLEAKIDGLKGNLEAKIDGVNEKFGKMFNFAKWSIGIASVPFCGIVIPIFIEIVLPIVKKWVGMIVLAGFLTATTTQAQLHIDIYPSQDNPTSQTIWIFSGSSTAFYGSSIRSSQNYHERDSWKVQINNGFYESNKPTNQFFNLAPLFSSTNQTDIESIESRLSGSSRVTSPFYSGLTFSASDTNSPTITIGSTSRPIGSLFMNDLVDDSTEFDEFGIRITPPNLVYSSNAVSRWAGSGILNKPISHFSEYPDRFYLGNRMGAPYFAENSANSIGILVSSRVIPEPAEYALVFGIFALAFVIFRRRFQKKGLN